MIFNVIQFTSLLVIILLCLLLWWFLLSYFFSCFSAFGFSRSFVLFGGLYLVFFVCLLLFVFFVSLLACKVTIWYCSLCLVARVVTRLVLGNYYLDIAICGHYAIVGLQDLLLVFFFFLIAYKLHCLYCASLSDLQGLNNHQYYNVGIDFPLYYMQITEFSSWGHKRMLRNQVVAMDIVACLFVLFLQTHLLYKLLVKPKVSLLIISYVFTVFIVHAVTNYYI